MPLLDYPQTENTFTEYELDERSFLLTSLQRAHIQSQLSLAAQLQLNLVFDPLNPVRIGLDQAFLNGQVVALQFLLDSSKSNIEFHNTKE